MAGPLLATRWNGILVFFSYLLAVFGSESCIAFVDEAVRYGVREQVAWDRRSRWMPVALLGGASVVFGTCGIFSMHFIGMTALSVGDRAIEYDPLLTTLSALFPLFFVYPALHITYLGRMHMAQDAGSSARTMAGATVANASAGENGMNELVDMGATGKCGVRALLASVVRSVRMSFLHLLGGAVMLGSGVGTMHYVGMWAQRVESATVEYNGWFILACVVVAITVSFIGLTLVFFLPNAALRTGTSLIIGGAVASAHYTGMQGITYRETRSIPPSALHMVENERDAMFLAVSVVLVFSCIRFVLQMALRMSIEYDRNVSEVTVLATSANNSVYPTPRPPPSMPMALISAQGSGSGTELLPMLLPSPSY